MVGRSLNLVLFVRRNDRRLSEWNLDSIGLFMDKIEEVLQNIEAETQKEFLPIVGRKKGRFLESLVRRHKPKSILEIGTLVGYSALLMGQNMKQGEIISLEISPEMADRAMKNISEAGLDDMIRIIVGDALENIPKISRTFDFVFIDAAKIQYYDYLKLLEKHKQLISPCVIVADNAKIFADRIRSYLDYVRNSSRYKSTYYDFGEDGMEVSVFSHP